MFDISLKRSLATVAVAAGLLAAAGPASAGTRDADGITYNGHAGLGASVYQHNQTDLEFLGVTDGTSNTIQFSKAATPRYTVLLENVLVSGLIEEDGTYPPFA